MGRRGERVSAEHLHLPRPLTFSSAPSLVTFPPPPLTIWLAVHPLVRSCGRYLSNALVAGDTAVDVELASPGDTGDAQLLPRRAVKQEARAGWR